jgi:hypothetical protein
VGVALRTSDGGCLSDAAALLNLLVDAALQQLIHFRFMVESRTLDMLAAIIVRAGKWGLEEQLDEKTPDSNCSAERRNRLLGHCRQCRASDQHA